MREIIALAVLHTVESMQARASARAKALAETCIPLDTQKKPQHDMVSMGNQTQIIVIEWLVNFLSFSFSFVNQGYLPKMNCLMLKTFLASPIFSQPTFYPFLIYHWLQWNRLHCWQWRVMSDDFLLVRKKTASPGNLCR